jgi:hypothetical protein
MSVSLSDITEARAKLMAAAPNMKNEISVSNLPSSEQLNSFNAVLSKDLITQRPKTDAQAYRKNKLSQLKRKTDKLDYHNAVTTMLLDHFSEQMQHGGLTLTDDGKLSKRANYQSSGANEIEAIIVNACGGECKTE